MRDSSKSLSGNSSSIFSAAVIVAALGYFVDVFDLLLFSIVRVRSLESLGYSGEELLDHGVFLLNMQMGGMLIGGIFWGVLGDRIGRVKVLFGSIITYSIANILNAYVQGIDSYAALRFISGIGLAGELGAGITLVSELVDKSKRGLATTFVATVGVSGAVVASIVTQLIDWRTAYLIGGGLGLLLLFLRVGVHESGVFHTATQDSSLSKGDLRLLLTPRRLGRFLSCIVIGLPIWFIIGIIVTFAPEIGKGLQVETPLVASSAVLFSYIGLTTGDLLSGLLSQYLRSRRKALLGFIVFGFAGTLVLLSQARVSTDFYYIMCGLLGLSAGYWAMFVTVAAEQFGTNLRATVTTMTPNLVRGAVVPMTLVFAWLKPSVGVVQSAALVGVGVFVASLIALYCMRETFHQDIGFVER